jgi:cytochrome c556
MKMRMTHRWLGKASLIAACGLLAVSYQYALAEAPAAAASALPAPDGADAEGLIFERQQLMIQLDRDAKTLGMIASGAEPKDKLAETTRAIAQGAKESLDAFRAKVPGGRSRPEVWENYADYMQRMEAFSVNAAKMAEVGETGDVTAVTGMMVDALPCKQCHDLYRAPRR